MPTHRHRLLRLGCELVIAALLLLSPPQTVAAVSPPPATATAAPDTATTPALRVYDPQQLLQRAISLGHQLEKRNCPPYLLGQQNYPFHHAAVAGNAFASAALVSLLHSPDDRLDGKTAPLVTDETRQEVAGILTALAKRSLQASAQRPFRAGGSSTIAGRRVSNSVLYRGYLLLMLSGVERVRGENEFSAFYDALAEDSARRILAAPGNLLPSYGRRIWPCDHAPLLSALHLHARLRPHCSEAGPRSVKILAERLASLLTNERGFITSLSADGKPLEQTARGTATAFASGFLLFGQPELARRFGSYFATTFCEPVFEVAACREWPRGVHRQADAASGPLVQGYGYGSSALGLAASRSLADRKLHAKLRIAAQVAGIEHYLAHFERYPLETAIFLWGVTASSWLG